MPDLKDGGGGGATDLFALDLAAAPSPANVPIQLHALAVACSRVVAGVKGAASGSGDGGGDDADVAKADIASTPHGAPLAALRRACEAQALPQLLVDGMDQLHELVYDDDVQVKAAAIELFVQTAPFFPLEVQ